MGHSAWMVNLRVGGAEGLGENNTSLFRLQYGWGCCYKPIMTYINKTQRALWMFFFFFFFILHSNSLSIPVILKPPCVCLRKNLCFLLPVAISVKECPADWQQRTKSPGSNRVYFIWSDGWAIQCALDVNREIVHRPLRHSYMLNQHGDYICWVQTKQQTIKLSYSGLRYT